MTSKKSVIQIDVEDGSFKKFAASFSKFKEEAKDTAKDAAEAAVQTARIAAAKKEILAAQEKLSKLTKEELSDLDAEAKARAKVAAEDKKSAELKQKAWDEQRKRYASQSKEKDDARTERAEVAKGLRDSAKWTADIARNIAAGALSAAKWLAFGAVASGFGLGGLASNAATARRQAQGYGINTGDLRAAGVNFGKYINPESALSNIANTKDSNDRWAFGRVGVNTTGRNAADILPEYLQKVVEAFKATGNNTSAAESTGLTKIISADELRALASLNPKELADTIKSFQADRKSFANDDDTNKGWQDFLVSLHRASQQIEVSLIKNLQTITPYLERFADGIAKAIDSFVSSGRLQEWIKAVGAGLQSLGEYLGSNEFREDVATFLNCIHSMAKVLVKLFPSSTPDAWTQKNVIDNPAGTSPITKDNPTGATTISKWQATKNVYGAIWDSLTGAKAPLSERNHNPGNLRVPGSTTAFQSFANDNDGIKALAGQLRLYEGRDHLTTIRGILNKYAPSSENDTGAYLADVTKRTGLGADQQLDPSNVDQLSKLIAAITKHENGRSNFTPGGVQKILVENATGGNAQISVAGLTAN